MKSAIINLPKLLISLMFLSIILGACKKDHNYGNGDGTIYDPNCDVEFDYSIGFPVGNIEYYEDSMQFKTPSFNPINPNEIVYQFINHTTQTYQIKKYNLLTHQNQVLIDNFGIAAQAAWGIGGIIALGGIDGNIWLINDNGTNLTQLTSNIGGNWKPSWAFGNKIVWDNVNSETGLRYNLIQSPSQSYPDTLINPGQGLNNFVISLENQFLVYSGDNSFYSLHILPNQTYSFIDFQMLPNQLVGTSHGLCWHTSGTKFYVSVYPNGEESEPGLYEIQYPSGIATKLIQYCDSKQYGEIACSPDGKYLVAERLDFRQDFTSQGLFTGNIERQTSLYLFNLKTKQEIKLELE